MDPPNDNPLDRIERARQQMIAARMLQEQVEARKQAEESQEMDRWLRLGEVLAVALDIDLTEAKTIAELSGAELPRGWTPPSAARILTQVRQASGSYKAQVELLNRELELAALRGKSRQFILMCLHTKTERIQMKSDVSKSVLQVGQSLPSKARLLTLQLSTKSPSILQ
jgi:hypothetical protein